MPAPRWLARFNHHVTNRLLGRVAPHLPGFGVVIHSGRRSHRQYRTPVNVFHHDGRYVIALTYGRESEWVKNVLAAGGCLLETHGQTRKCTDPRLFHDSRHLAVPVLVRVPLGLLHVDDFLSFSAQPRTADIHD
jgi:deazaflavin-dependent oxidoreductase (nitroreductase family)